MTLVMRCTPRFLTSYRKGLVLQGLAEGAAHDFVRRYRSDPSTVARLYDRVEGVRPLTVLEIKLAGAPRMIAHWESPKLTLLDMGGHDTTTSMSAPQIRAALATAQDVPPSFWPETPSHFFVSNRDGRYRALSSDEFGPEWLTFLDDQQFEISNDIADAMLDALSHPRSRGKRFHMVLGGPGTGKTCVLLNVLKRLEDCGVRVRLEMPDQVLEYMRHATSIDVRRFSGNPSENESGGRGKNVRPLELADAARASFIDDPSSLEDIHDICEQIGDETNGVVLFDADPLQFDADSEDGAFQQLLRKYGVVRHDLRRCYRQKENVGKQALAFINQVAESTPFVDPVKIGAFTRKRRDLTKLANGLEFPNPFGYTELVESAKIDDFAKVLKQIKAHPAGMWKHWPPLAVVLADPHYPNMPRDWQTKLTSSRIRHRLYYSNMLGEMKGIEFQHIILILGPRFYEQLEHGFEGSGQAAYQHRRLLRIPLSRARDSFFLMVPRGATRATAGMKVPGSSRKPRLEAP